MVKATGMVKTTGMVEATGSTSTFVTNALEPKVNFCADLSPWNVEHDWALVVVERTQIPQARHRGSTPRDTLRTGKPRGKTTTHFKLEQRRRCSSTQRLRPPSRGQPRVSDRCCHTSHARVSATSSGLRGARLTTWLATMHAWRCFSKRLFASREPTLMSLAHG